MVRRIRLVVALAALVVFILPAVAWCGDNVKEALEVRAKLGQRIKFAGFDDPKMPLKDALAFLGKQVEVEFDINDAAFAEAGIGDVDEKPVSEKPLPAMTSVPAEVLLRKVLGRLRITATYVIRGGIVEITTEQALATEFFANRSEGPMTPLVHVDAGKKALRDVLKELSGQAGRSIVIDARCEEKAQAPVTARLDNVPLDTAVRLLADMADLRSVEVDGVLYVTAKANAQALEGEQTEKRMPPPLIRSPGAQ